MTNKSNNCLYFDNEEIYNEFVAELHGEISAKRKAQLAKTRKLIAKHAYLLDDFVVEQ